MEENKKEKNESEQKKDSTFRKVETKNKSKNFDASKKKPSHKVIKAIFIIILLLIAAYCIFFCRNLIILSNLKEAVSQYNGITNYSYESVYTGSHATFRQNDTALRVDLVNDQSPEKSLIIWKDKTTNNEIIAFPNQKTAIQSSTSSTTVDAKLPFTLANMGDGFYGLALYSLIYTENLNGRECYVIQESSDYKMWIEKDTGLLYKMEYSDDMYTEITKVEINSTDEIYKPDLTGYKINIK